jgi:hypothetical protein
MKTVFAVSCLALGMMAGAASAANVLTIVENTTAVLGDNFDPTPGTGGLVATNTVLVVNGGVDNLGGFGLKLTDTADVTFTYLGKEAGNTNVFFGTSQIFSTGAGEANTAVTLLDVTANATGFLPFSFTSNGETVATNGVVFANASSIAFKFLEESPDFVKVLVLLNDPGADTDYDDMVLQIEARASKGDDPLGTPIPGGVVLLMSGLAGLGYMGRMRRTKKA